MNHLVSGETKKTIFQQAKLSQDEGQTNLQSRKGNSAVAEA
jgi:hypothetical protein